MSRKTEKGVPVYDDEEDTFLLSSGEDLVPVGPGAAGVYRPRTDAAFARIRHHKSADDDYWEVRDRSGLVNMYGTPGALGQDPAALSDPADDRRIFAWKLTETRDTFGNRIAYEYALAPGGQGLRRWNQIYLSAINYADYGDHAAPQYLFALRFRYEERPDPFSDRRANFEIRTTMRCNAVEMFLLDGTVERLFRRYTMDYAVAEPNGVSLLRSVQMRGVDDGGAEELLPPLELDYTRFLPGRQKFLPLTGRDQPSGSLDQPGYELADVDGDGLPDLLELDGVFQYWRNLGGGALDVRRVTDEVPAGLSLADPDVQLLDANGDGHVDLMVTGQRQSGFYPVGAGAGWDARTFQPYRYAPSFRLKDPEVRLLDLTGDGITDALRTGTRLECFFNNPPEGWNRTRAVTRRGLDAFPNVSFSDPRLQIACMTGDGLQGIVFVANGHVEYWPSLGHGDWGARVVMRNSPRFPSGYDPRRVLLGDVDGDGAADLVYVGARKVTLWINRSGDGWSEPIEIEGTPGVADANSLRIADMLGNGTPGLLWSAPFGGAAARHSLFFLDFTGGVKPYLLDSIVNNMGAETHVDYASSTRFYVADERRPETRWKTKLPFPVQVVAGLRSVDHITGNELTSQYTYHHGYWDGVEREFRGFGRVEQLDSQTFPGVPFYSPPTLSKTWFHLGPTTGQYAARPHTEDFTAEYWAGPGEDPPALLWPPLPSGLGAGGMRSALRALRGSTLRAELYALDGAALEGRPYLVSEHSYGLRTEVPPGQGATGGASSTRRGVFFPYARAQRQTQWERGTDPRTNATFFDDYDAFGQPHKTVSIAVPRGRDYRQPAPPGAPYLATLSENDFAQIDEPDHFIVDRPSRVSFYEVPNDGSPSLLQLHDAILNQQTQTVLFGQVLQFYDGDAYVGLPLGRLGARGALVRAEELRLTEDLLRTLYKYEDSPGAPPYLVHDGPPPWTDEYPVEFRSRLTPLAGYVYRNGPGDQWPGAPGYWAASTRLCYDFQQNPSGRGLTLSLIDPLGHETRFSYDSFALLPESITDPAGMVTSAAYDYRFMLPREVTDPNANRTLFTYTALGLPASRALMGEPGENVGDTPEAPSTRWTYNYLAYLEARQPVSSRTIRREHYITDEHVPPPLRDRTVETVEYSDGLGRHLQTRTQAEDVAFGNHVFGDDVLPADQSQTGGTTVGHPRAPASPPRVAVTGWQTYDNKGHTVEDFQPFFAEGWDYAEPTLGELGQRVIYEYDAPGRRIRTVNPGGSELLTVFGIPLNLEDPAVYAPTPWETYVYDANDNAGRTDPAGSKDYESHWNTPSSGVTDVLGRVVETVERNSHDPAGWYTTRSAYDIRGNLLTVVDQMGRLAVEYRYDLGNNPWRVGLLDGGIASTVYDAAGLAVEQRDSRGALKLYSSDQLLRPVEVWARDGGADAVTPREQIVYGDSPGAGLSWEQAQDANLLGVPYKHFDESGLLTLSRCDFKNNVLEKERRVLSDAHVLARAAPRPAPPAPPSAPLDLAVYQTSYAYDALDRVGSLLYPADADGQRKELRPVYGRAGQLLSVLLDGQTIIERIAYDAGGRRTLAAYGNGVMIRYAYDARTFRLARMRSEPYTSPAPYTYQPVGDAPLQDYAYRYDLAGNLLGLHDRTPGSGVPADPDRLDRAFTYDPLYRTLAATGRECGTPPVEPWSPAPRCHDLGGTRLYTEAYEFDPAGNLLQLRHAGENGDYTRDLELAPGTNRLSALRVGGVVYDYACDASGNITREDARRFTWDHSDRLVAFAAQPVGPATEAHYLYDGTGRRVKKLVVGAGGQTASTVYVDLLFEASRFADGAAVVENSTLHVMDDRTRVATLRVGAAPPGDPSPTVQYALQDQLGSSNVVTDGAGAWLQREEYTPFGETSFGSYDRKRYRFTDKERDEESGLYYFGARYLGPYLGRWTSCDPAPVADGPNLYAYVRGNPMRFTDARGTNGGEPASTGGASRVTTEHTSATQSSTASTASNLANTGNLATKSYYFPRDLKGDFLVGPYNLWSGAGKAEAKTASGYMMEVTPYHHQAIKDLQAHGWKPGAQLPTAIWQGVWDTTSFGAARDAAISQVPVRQFGTPTPDSVQTRIEVPAVKKYGMISGGMSALPGVFNLLSLPSYQNPVSGFTAMVGGVYGIIGSGLWTLGTQIMSTDLMKWGGRTSLIGNTIGAVPSAVALPQNIKKGEWVEGVGNLTNVTSGAVLTAGVLKQAPLLVKSGGALGVISFGFMLGAEIYNRMTYNHK